MRRYAEEVEHHRPHDKHVTVMLGSSPENLPISAANPGVSDTFNNKLDKLDKIK